MARLNDDITSGQVSAIQGPQYIATERVVILTISRVLKGEEGDVSRRCYKAWIYSRTAQYVPGITAVSRTSGTFLKFSYCLDRYISSIRVHTLSFHTAHGELESIFDDGCWG